MILSDSPLLAAVLLFPVVATVTVIGVFMGWLTATVLRTNYDGVLLDALKLCSPLPVTESLGHAIAGRPMLFRFNDTRKERKV